MSRRGHLEPIVRLLLCGYLLIPLLFGQPTVIPFKSGKVDPATRGGGMVTPRTWRGEAVHQLLQFSDPPDVATVAELRQRGIRLLRVAADNAVVAQVPPGTDLEGLGLRWTGWIESAAKLSPALVESDGSTYVVVFHPDVDMGDARAMVHAAGLDLIDNSSLLEHQLLATGPYERVDALAGYDEVAYIFPASQDLIQGTPVTGCDGPVVTVGDSGEVSGVAEYVKNGRGWPKTGPTVDLKYAFSVLTTKRDVASAKSELVRALQEWARYAPLDFQPGTNTSAARTIAILFASRAHGDPYPFDGRGKTLAHTFYPAPPNVEPLAGDMHFDDDEDWRLGGAVDLFAVALHEAGHALGLAHSDKPAAVMYPYYKLTTGLNADDIAGIQDLYGARGAATPAAPAPTPPATPTTPTAPTVPPSTPPSTPSPSPAPPSTPPADYAPPSLTITSPGFSIASTSAASLTFRGTASDNIGVASVKWTTTAGGSGTATGTTAWSADISLQVGTTTVTVKAFDAAGNSSWRSVTIVRR